MSRKKKNKSLSVSEKESDNDSHETVKLKNLLRRMRCFNLADGHSLSIEGDNGIGKPEVLTLLPLEMKIVDRRILESPGIKEGLSPRDSKKRPTLRILG